MNKNIPLISFISIACLLVACSGQSSNQSPDIDSLENRLAELEAKEAIRTLFTDYGRTLDTRDFKAFGELYAENAVYIGGDESHGPEAIAKQLEDVITANATGANLHIFTNEKITVDIENGTANAISRGAFYVQDEAGNPTPLMFATYTDELILENGSWKFNRREVAGDVPGPANEDRF